MKQKLILLAAITGLIIVSQSSFSLGMGKIQVYSALNEPLQSSIELFANADEELLNLEVKLASSEDYQKVGLDKSFVPGNIIVAFDEENPYQINVTSNGPVSEPIVSILLDVNWNNGRILRELTVLLDPPIYDSVNSNTQVNNVVVESIQNNTISEPVEEYTEPELQTRAEDTRIITNADFVEDRQTTETVPVHENHTFGEISVEAGDTLWRIANSNKTGGLSTHQMMMAIYNRNPDAFTNNNINQLIKGSRLAMPTISEAENIGISEALAQVKSHHQSWSPAQQDFNTYQTEETTETEYEVPTSTLDYGVQLSGGDNQGSDSGQSNSDESTGADLQAIEEDLYNKDAENSDLKERISELEDIVEQQQDVIEISDDGLANLESQLENAADDVAENLDVAVDDAVTGVVDDVWDQTTETVDELSGDIEDIAVESSDLPVGDVDANNEGAVDVVEEVTSNQQNETVKEDIKAVTPVTRPEKQSFVDTTINWVMDNLIWVLAGLGGLIALLLLPKVLGGRGEQDEDETSFLDDIKNRNRETEQEAIDAVDTKVNQPLADITDDVVDAEDDVLAELDGSIDFDDAFAETETQPEAESDDSFEDEITELVDEAAEPEEDGFDLDGFLNDEISDDVAVTKDHSATLADVSFDDVDSELTDIDLAVEDDMSFDDLDLDLDDEVEDLSNEASEAVDDFKIEVEDQVEDVIDDGLETADIVKEEADEFSFDDEDFDLDLSEELEESIEEITDVDTGDDNASDNSASDDFNDMLDISDENADAFEIEEEVVMDEEIDLGLEDLMDDTDAIDTKLDLAKAYIEMGDQEGAKNLLDEIYAEGTEEQISVAKKLLDGIDG